MTGGRQLLLHLGSHKTGSTSIQRALFLNKSLLRSQNVSLFYFDLDGSERKNGNALPWVNFERDGRIEGSVHPELAAKLGEMPGDVLMSAEHFSWIFDPEIIRSFHLQLKQYFDRVRLIVYLRGRTGRRFPTTSRAAECTGDRHSAITLARARRSPSTGRTFSTI